MKSLTWPLIYISTTILQHLAFAQTNIDLLNAGIQQDLDDMTLNSPLFRASDDIVRFFYKEANIQ